MIHVLARDDLARLFEVLEAEGYAVVGPTVRDDAIVYEEIGSPDDLPIGLTDEQAPGRYRLHPRDDDRLFGYAVGPHSWKQLLFPSREVLHRTREGRSERVTDAPRRAFVGVRACDLAAVDIQDRIFLRDRHADPRYGARRERAFLVAVNCGEAGGLCFCASMGTGPRVEEGADLVLTELPDRFLVEVGSEAGRAVLDRLPVTRAPADAAAEIERIGVETAAQMGRSLDTEDLPGVLFANLDHPRWDEVAERCLSCGNCTLVCPTCFCSSVDEVSDLDATTTERVRRWDSCFGQEHSTIHGVTFRPRTKDRYRQWLTHKFGSWVSQFGTSGCVGCGRCIAWCPVGIDVTEELTALREGEAPVSIPEARPPASPPADDLVPRAGRVLEVRRETADVVTLRIEAPAVRAGGHGQFHMVGLPGVGEAPISLSGGAGSLSGGAGSLSGGAGSLSGGAGSSGGEHVHTIRAVGGVTRALAALEAGAMVQLRGPYGSCWPLAEARGGPVVVVAGGIGLAPLRSAILAMADAPADYPDVRLFYGARTPEDVVFADEILDWGRSPNVRVEITVDRAGPCWRGHVGVVTRLLRPDTVPAGATALLCGPEIMMGFTRRTLTELGVPDDRIHLSMERHMDCAAGFCGRCQYAHWFVCKDGPVFRYDVIAPIFGHEGF